MKEMNKYRKWIGTQNAEQRAATNRMALFPENAEVIFVGEDIWVVRPLVTIISERQPIVSYLACHPSRGQTVHIPGHSCAVPKDAAQSNALHPPSARARASLENTNLH